MIPTRTFPFLALLLLFAPPAAHASVVEYATPEALAVQSDAVVHGTVVARRSHLADRGRRIFTVLSVRVAEALKGDARGAVEVVVPGGEAGGLGQHVAGLPRLETGDEVVLFLERRRAPRPSFRLERLGLSVYRVREGRVTRAVDGLEVVTGPLDAPAPLAAEPPLDLPTLKARIRRALAVQP